MLSLNLPSNRNKRPSDAIVSAETILAAWRNGIASDYEFAIRRLQVRSLRWSSFLPSFHLALV